MSFAKNLAKGFIRSAVNQVGRDGGRVISNSIYKGKNYVPVANTQQAQQSVPPMNGNMENVIITNKPLSSGKIFLFLALSVLAFPLGSLGVAIYGLVKYLDKDATMEWTETHPHYVTDRRYKDNMRFEGMVTERHKSIVRGTPEALAINKKNGVIAMAIGAGCGLVIWLSILFF